MSARRGDKKGDPPAAGAGDFTLKPLNNVKVKPIPMKGGGLKPAKGHDMFPDPYPNIVIFGPKANGKTTIIFNIIKKCSTAKTLVLVFSSSYNQDQSWRAIEEWCDEHGRQIEGHMNVVEEGRDLLADYLEEWKEKSAEEEAKKEKNEEVPTGAPIRVLQAMQDGSLRLVTKKELPPPPPPAEKKSRSKFAPVDTIVIFDDVTTALRRKSVNAFLMTNRHWRTVSIVSVHSIMAIEPDARLQVGYWLLLQKLEPEKLELVRETAGLPVTFEQFKRMYDIATAQRYSFLYVDVREIKFRRNFDTDIVPPAAAKK